MTLEDEPPPGQKVSSVLLGKSVEVGWEMTLSCLVVKVKSDAVKKNIA